MSIPSWAVKGAKVVCIYAETTDPYRAPVHREVLVEGGVYTLRRVYLHGGLIAACELEGEDEFDFHLDRFRPLVSDKTEVEDVALFRHHLDQRVPEKA